MSKGVVIKSKKIGHILAILVSYLFCAVMGLIAICALFANGGSFSIVKNNSLLAITGGVVLLCFFVVLWRKLNKLPEVKPKTELRAAVCLFALVALLISISVYCLHPLESTWDPKYVSIGANGILDGEELPEYLSIYPFNLTLSFLAIPIVWLIRALHLGVNINCVLSAVSGLLVFLTFLVNYLTLRRLTTKNKALFVLSLAALFAPLTHYASIFYSDTISQFLICLLLFLVTKCIKQRKTASFPKKIIFAALIGLVSCLAIQVKATTGIFLIALIMSGAIYLIGQKINLKKAAGLAIVAIFFFVVPTVGIKKAISAYTDSSMAHPVSNWIAMGLSGEGGYNTEDADRTTELLRKGEDANAANIEVIKARVKNYGKRGLFEHLVIKTAAVWGCGDIGTSRALSPEPHYSSVLSETIRDGGVYNLAYLKIANCIWVAILLALLIGSIIDLRKSQSFYKTLAKLAIIGLFIFLEVWETQSRYLYVFLPFIFALAVFMLFEISESDTIRVAVLTIKGFIRYEKNNREYQKIKILDANKTMKQIKKGKSVIRLGDGEMAVMLGHSIWFQKQSDQLREDLEAVIRKAKTKSILVCVPRTIISLEGYRLKARGFWYRELLGTRHEWKKRLSEKVSYGETSVTRARTDLNSRTQDKIFADWKKLFAGKDIVLVEGATTRTGVNNDLFDGAKSVRRIIGPPKNAYDRIPQILQNFELQGINKSSLVLVSLGPAAKKIAMELFDRGYQVIDMGHLGQEYAFYYNGVYRKAEDDDRFDNATNAEYEKSIIARIEK